MARILLIEDDPALSRGIIALLKGAGHAADCAKDGDLRYYRPNLQRGFEAKF